MVHYTDYRAYHIARALGDNELTANDIRGRYNAWLEDSDNRRLSTMGVSSIIANKLLGRYVEVCGVKRPAGKPSRRGSNIYRLTVEGRVWLDRHAEHWGYTEES
jgi:hypothetical protein